MVGRTLDHEVIQVIWWTVHIISLAILWEIVATYRTTFFLENVPMKDGIFLLGEQIFENWVKDKLNNWYIEI